MQKKVSKYIFIDQTLRKQVMLSYLMNHIIYKSCIIGMHAIMTSYQCIIASYNMTELSLG